MTMEEAPNRGRRVYERHLDLLLAEELSCRPAFARWMIDECLRDAKLPAGAPDEVIVEISHDDDIGDDPDAAGENDLFLEARWNDGGRVLLLIEDKLDAVVQPRQFERYLQRIDHHQGQPDVTAAGGAAIAPAGYLKRHSADLGPLTAISVEDIAKRLKEDAKTADPEVARRLLWRAERLVSIRQSRRLPVPEDEETVAARDWIINRLEQIETSARVVHRSLMFDTYSECPPTDRDSLWLLTSGCLVVNPVEPAARWPNSPPRYAVLNTRSFFDQ